MQCKFVKHLFYLTLIRLFLFKYKMIMWAGEHQHRKRFRNILPKENYRAWKIYHLQIGHVPHTNVHANISTSDLELVSG